MKLTKRKIFLLALLLAALTLTSCEVSDTTEEEQLWEASFYESEHNLASVSFFDGYIYYYASDSYFSIIDGIDADEDTPEPTKYYRQKIGESEPEELKFSGQAETYIGSVNMQPDYDGNMYIYFGTNELAKYDESGNELYSIDVDYCIPDTVTVSSTAVDSKGHLYMRSNKGVYLFDTDGTYKGYVSCSGGSNGIVNLNGDIYLLSLNETIAKISFDTASLGDEISSKIFARGLASYGDSGFISCTAGNIQYVDLNTLDASVLIQLANCGIRDSDVIALAPLPDENLAVILCRDEVYSIAMLTKIDSSEKTIITLGTFEPSTALQDKVADFNRSSADYLIVIKQYYDRTVDNTIGGTGYQDALTKFHLDIVSGNCPDILNLSFDEVSAYADKGLFEDLAPYLEQSGLSLIESIAEAYTFDGSLAAIPPNVQLRTIVGRSEDIEGITGWTLDEMIAYVEAHPDETVFDVGSSAMLEYCLRFNQSKFVDWDNYACNFETEEFYKLLEFCNGYTGGSNSINTHPQVNIGMYNASLYEVAVASPSEYLALQQLLDDENITFVGFPTDSGSGTAIEENNGSYAIFSGSKNKAYAWDFIESMLTDVPEYTHKTFYNGFPAVNETKEAYFAEVLSEPWEEVKVYDSKGYHTELERRSVSGGNIFGKYTLYLVPFEEELEPIVDLLENAEVAVTNDSTILDIILENAEEYFSGEKSAEEAAKQIQSRVKIYLSERK